MALDDPQAVHSTLPTIEVDGMSYPLLTRNIVAVRREEALGGMSSLELSVTDWVARAAAVGGGRVCDGGRVAIMQHLADYGS